MDSGCICMHFFIILSKISVGSSGNCICLELVLTCSSLSIESDPGQSAVFRLSELGCNPLLDTRRVREAFAAQDCDPLLDPRRVREPFAAQGCDPLLDP